MDDLKVCDLTVVQIKWLKTFYETLTSTKATEAGLRGENVTPTEEEIIAARARASEEHDVLPKVPFNVMPRLTWRMTPGVNSADEVETVYDVRTHPNGELIKECRTAQRGVWHRAAVEQRS